MATTTRQAPGAISNAALLDDIDGLNLVGDVLAVFERTRERRDQSGTFTTIECHVATRAKVWQIEFFDAKLCQEVTGLAPDDLTNKRVMLPIRMELWRPVDSTDAGRAYWKVRRPFEEPGEGGPPAA
jgi:hypothetical protein